MKNYINPVTVTQTINELMVKALKYEEIKQKRLIATMKYANRKREENDIVFINKQLANQKKYYEKNKDKINKKNLERYYKKQSMSVELQNNII